MSVHGVVVQTASETRLGSPSSALAVLLPAGHAVRHLGRRLRREREAHVDGVLGDVLVALRHLVAADGRAAARAVRHHLEALVEQALVPDGAQQPPHRLDVVVGVGVVGVVQVDPEPDALGEPLPLLEVGGDALLAERVELGDAVGLDLLLAVDAQATLDLELHGEAVGVPARLAGDAVAAHGLVAREEVLEDARDDVVRARPAVGGGRPLVEHEDRGVLAALEALVEDVVGLPELEDARVQRREVDARRDVLEPGLTVCHETRFLLHLDGTAILPDTVAATGPAVPCDQARPSRATAGRDRPRPARPAPGPAARAARRRSAVLAASPPAGGTISSDLYVRTSVRSCAFKRTLPRTTPGSTLPRLDASSPAGNAPDPCGAPRARRVYTFAMIDGPTDARARRAQPARASSLSSTTTAP